MNEFEEHVETTLVSKQTIPNNVKYINEVISDAITEGQILYCSEYSSKNKESSNTHANGGKNKHEK